MIGRTPHKRGFERDNDARPGRRRPTPWNGSAARDLAHRSYNTLSGGEKQRALIARAVAQGADHLILDEPTNHLDIRYQLEVLELVAGLGVTVLAALHDLSLAALFCDPAYLMADGQIVTGGPPGPGDHRRDRPPRLRRRRAGHRPPRNRHPPPHPPPSASTPPARPVRPTGLARPGSPAAIEMTAPSGPPSGPLARAGIAHGLSPTTRKARCDPGSARPPIIDPVGHAHAGSSAPRRPPHPQGRRDRLGPASLVAPSSAARRRCWPPAAARARRTSAASSPLTRPGRAIATPATGHRGGRGLSGDRLRLRHRRSPTPRRRPGPCPTTSTPPRT